MLLRRLARSVPLAVLGLGLLVGCGGDGDDGDDAAPSTTTDPAEPGAEASPSSETTAADPSSTTAPAAEQLALRGDGLGVVDLGAAPDDAVAAVSAVLGAPGTDRGWEPSFSGYGTCPGERIRAVEWEGLVLLFTDGETDHGTGEHLFAWRVRAAPPALSTSEGFGLGATVADAEELYPGAVEVVPPEEPFPGFLELTTADGVITAYLDGDTVTNLEAGTPCGE